MGNSISALKILKQSVAFLICIFVVLVVDDLLGIDLRELPFLIHFGHIMLYMTLGALVVFISNDFKWIS